MEKKRNKKGLCECFCTIIITSKVKINIFFKLFLYERINPILRGPNFRSSRHNGNFAFIKDTPMKHFLQGSTPLGLW